MAQLNASTPKHIEIYPCRSCPKCSKFLIPIIDEVYQCCGFSFSCVKGSLQMVTKILANEKIVFKFSKNHLCVRDLISKKETVSRQKFNLNDFEELSNYITAFMVLS